MAEQNRNDQDQREGGYGDDTGEALRGGGAEKGASAAGRENPVDSTTDADEALGNRTGGYGGNPPAEDNSGTGGQE